MDDCGLVSGVEVTNIEKVAVMDNGEGLRQVSIANSMVSVDSWGAEITALTGREGAVRSASQDRK